LFFWGIAVGRDYPGFGLLSVPAGIMLMEGNSSLEARF